MKSILAIVAALFSLGITHAAWAVEWVEIDKSDGLNYVDKDSLQKNGSSVVFGAKTVLRDSSGNLVRDIEGYLSADCNTNSYRVLKLKNLLTGETLNLEEKAPVNSADPSSVTAKLIAYACANK
ncbi:hypothetical protein [Pseudanabaena sp. PCC 6802]|uniref:hypothetical protein n=1 Tax=Pseudanabaena sp. PCC 6802 TaxID=118173 RepID=UPI00034DEEDC|nr:hypothetical protein [Pseudanabaena sp. PCC 6802]